VAGSGVDGSDGGGDASGCGGLALAGTLFETDPDGTVPAAGPKQAKAVCHA